MISQVDSAADAIAAVLAPQPPSQYTRWRWGTVTAVNSDGTMDVEVGGSTMPSVRALTSAMAAQVGDRVRVDYLGTDAVVAGVRATRRYMPGDYAGAFFSSNNVATITLPSNNRFLLVSAHNSTAALNGIAIATGSTVFKVAGMGSITFTRSGLTITATTTGGNPGYYLIDLD